MKQIRSIENQKIKQLKKLTQKKYRKQYSSFLVENFVIIRDAFFDGIEMEAIYVTEYFLKHNKFKESKHEIPESKIFIIDEKINNFVSDLSTPSGVIAQYKIKDSKLNKNLPSIYLNGVGDPGNLGTILRTCLAFGFENIVCDEGCAEIYNQKTISAAKDAIFKLNIIKDNKLSFLKEDSKKIPIYTADAIDGEDVADFTFPEKYILVFGSESHGINLEIKELSKTSLKINISDKIESLNVSNALAIFLYEIKRK
ncbi:MAG: RNA methyltransferase [Patescibacteria group bacterium]|nr:RNA methyltransferase [Patescibacteria group bacterium]